MFESQKLVALCLLSFRIHTILCQNSQNYDRLFNSIFPTRDTNDQTTEYANKVCGLGKECVKRILCNDGNIIRDGRTLLDIRIEYDAPCSYLEQCCHIRHVLPDMPTSTMGSNSRQNNGCGYRNKNGVVYEITGSLHNEAEFAEFPWMVLISGNDGSYICGGSLIASNVVLTTAHCKLGNRPDMLSVRAGEWDIESLFEPYIHQNRMVKEIIRHENFNSQSLHNDIALLILRSPFTLAPNVQPICLPTSNIAVDTNNCVSSGWGNDKFGRNGVYQNILKKMELSIVSHATCQAQLRKTRLGRFFELDQSLTCAGGEAGKDMCTGDGGSPLVCADENDPERYYQIGIVSWGIGCHTDNVPGVYANVWYLRPWINEKLRERGFYL